MAATPKSVKHCVIDCQSLAIAAMAAPTSFESSLSTTGLEAA